MVGPGRPGSQSAEEEPIVLTTWGFTSVLTAPETETGHKIHCFWTPKLVICRGLQNMINSSWA